HGLEEPAGGVQLDQERLRAVPLRLSDFPHHISGRRGGDDAVEADDFHGGCAGRGRLGRGGEGASRPCRNLCWPLAPLRFGASGGLSSRSRTIRGNRRANPEVCRSLIMILSNATSRTIRGSTIRTRPRSSTVWARNHAVRRAISSSVSPE